MDVGTYLALAFLLLARCARHANVKWTSGVGEIARKGERVITDGHSGVTSRVGRWARVG